VEAPSSQRRPAAGVKRHLVKGPAGGPAGGRAKNAASVRPRWGAEKTFTRSLFPCDVIATSIKIRFIVYPPSFAPLHHSLPLDGLFLRHSTITCIISPVPQHVRQVMVCVLSGVHAPQHTHHKLMMVCTDRNV
jgi:hypothetical protein